MFVPTVAGAGVFFRPAGSPDLHLLWTVSSTLCTEQFRLETLQSYDCQESWRISHHAHTFLSLNLAAQTLCFVCVDSESQDLGMGQPPRRTSTRSGVPQALITFLVGFQKRFDSFRYFGVPKAISSGP